MSAVPVTFVGICYPRDKSHDPFPATFVGFAHITGLEVGGGPIIPPEMGGGDKPPGTWGGAGEGFPTPPIVIPEPPPVDLPPPPNVKPFPPEGGWGYSDRTGWVYKPKEDEASPKGGRR